MSSFNSGLAIGIQVMLVTCGVAWFRDTETALVTSQNKLQPSTFSGHAVFVAKGVFKDTPMLRHQRLTSLYRRTATSKMEHFSWQEFLNWH